ncbi:MAG: hypothetical protein OHK0022_56120 [Roseiflexaceae bacterium]
MSGGTFDGRKQALFRAVFDPQSYRNIAYLLLSFPLGIIYFVTLVTGASLGIGLSVIWIGIPILLGLLALCAAFVAFERGLARGLLGMVIDPPEQVVFAEQSAGARLRSYLTAPSTWSGLLFLLVKFPLGIGSFVITATLVAVTLGLLATPFFYDDVPVNVGYNILTQLPVQISTLPQALLCTLGGVFFGMISIYALNTVAAFHRAIVAQLLGGQARAPQQLGMHDEWAEPAPRSAFVKRP